MNGGDLIGPLLEGSVQTLGPVQVVMCAHGIRPWIGALTSDFQAGADAVSSLELFQKDGQASAVVPDRGRTRSPAADSPTRQPRRARRDES